MAHFDKGRKYKFFLRTAEAKHFVIVHFPMDEIEQKRFNNIKEFESYIDNGVL
jgi:hypothetical protein